MATGRWARWASCGALAVWLLAGCGGPLTQAPKPVSAPAVQPAEITDIQVAGTGDAVQITVITSAKVAYSLVQQANPPRLFLELSGAALGLQQTAIPVNRGAVAMIRPSTTGTNASVEVFLSAEAAYDIEALGASIVLNVSPKFPAVAEPPAPPPAEEAQPEQSAAPVAEQASAEMPAAPAPEAAAPAPVEPPLVEVVAPAPPVPAGPRALTAIDVKKQPDGLVVVLEGNGPLPHEYFLVEGKSLVVDIAGAANKVWPMKKKVDDAWVAQIRIGEHTQPKKATRVVFDLKKVGEYRVQSSGNGIVVSFGAAALMAAAPAASEGAVNTLNTVGEVTARALDASTRLEIPTAVRPDFTIVDSGDPAKIIVEIANARIAQKDLKSLDLAVLNRELVKVSSFPYTRGDAQLVRVVAQLRQPVPFRATAEPDRVVVEFERAAAPVVPAPVLAPAPAPGGGAPLVLSGPAVVPGPESGGGKPAVTLSTQRPAFTGRRLSLDFKDADVNDILRLISEVSGLNFVAGSEVKGTVTIKLADVPWDQALDIILKTNQPQLAQIRESENIVRITTADKILDEEQRRRRVEEDKKKTVDAQRALEPLVTKSYYISYGDVKTIGDVVDKNFKSPDRGRVQPDERTKTLLVQDIASVIAQIDAAIATLDTPTPAVLVEARIVEVESNYDKQLGIQWNLDGVKDAAHGNATEFAFPNSVSVGGTQSGSDGSSYLVNLPAAAATSGVGISFGHIANTLSLDLKLSAMEKMQRIKILSNPKVLVIQNQKAVINVGRQLPIPKTDSEGNRTVEWKDVGILLEVKPQVTNDKRVFLEIKIEKSDQGQDVQTTEGEMFSINTSRADTKVLIADGETTVIGGLFTQTTDNSDNTVPGLSKLPIFGWLFKSKSDQVSKTEMMIFLTPRLVVI